MATFYYPIWSFSPNITFFLLLKLHLALRGLIYQNKWHNQKTLKKSSFKNSPKLVVVAIILGLLNYFWIDTLSSFSHLQCLVNGVSYDKIAQEGGNVTTLEIFFSGFPRMVGLFFFPNLCQLTIVDQTIEHIEGLENCPLLQELWIVQCRLRVSFLKYLCSKTTSGTIIYDIIISFMSFMWN